MSFRYCLCGSAMILKLFIYFFLYPIDKIEPVGAVAHVIQELDRNYNFLNGAALYANLAITMHFEQSN